MGAWSMISQQEMIPFKHCTTGGSTQVLKNWISPWVVQVRWYPRVTWLVTPIPALQVAIQADFTSAVRNARFKSWLRSSKHSNRRIRWKTLGRPSIFQWKQPMFSPFSSIFHYTWGHEREDWQLFGESSGDFLLQVPIPGCGLRERERFSIDEFWYSFGAGQTLMWALSS